ncbi:MAG: choice-of-anchor H family protein [Gammaproteobacteria bacterium]|nr:choice-of-anchor H family protein [Gammaproteobacteria bacterium]
MKRIIRTSATAFLLLLTAVGLADTETETRQSLTSEGHGIERGHVGDGKTTYNEHEPLQMTDGGKVRERTASKAGSGSTAQSANPGFWFYTADVELFNDFDRDGYYFGIDLLFDADTAYSVADVYAVIYLSYEYGPWNEYAATEDFTLLGSSGSDEYIVETELVSGYLTGNYDILIELYDAWDDTFLASFGPEDTSELSILPLEDSTRDAVSTGGTQVVVNSGGGGSFGWLLLLGLLAVRMTLRPQAARLSK